MTPCRFLLSRSSRLVLMLALQRGHWRLLVTNGYNKGYHLLQPQLLLYALLAIEVEAVLHKARLLRDSQAQCALELLHDARQVGQGPPRPVRHRAHVPHLVVHVLHQSVVDLIVGLPYQVFAVVGVGGEGSVLLEVGHVLVV
ncbi:hypothetical protein FGO68_gene263 [Halteria grandinella]|uniref:Uncharacterized protein n=1 Tax=Halteria grandinella TaxID=5974 RepID=A0A8J8T225_HALGN|nr:hypothetical protein FGO68_gene263 [Halteria grandinella]